MLVDKSLYEVNSPTGGQAGGKGLQRKESSFKTLIESLGDEGINRFHPDPKNTELNLCGGGV